MILSPVTDSPILLKKHLFYTCQCHIMNVTNVRTMRNVAAAAAARDVTEVKRTVQGCEEWSAVRSHIAWLQIPD